MLLGRSAHRGTPASPRTPLIRLGASEAGRHRRRVAQAPSSGRAPPLAPRPLQRDTARWRQRTSRLGRVPRPRQRTRGLAPQQRQWMFCKDRAGLPPALQTRRTRKATILRTHVEQRPPVLPLSSRVVALEQRRNASHRSGLGRGRTWTIGVAILANASRGSFRLLHPLVALQEGSSSTGRCPSSQLACGRTWQQRSSTRTQRTTAPSSDRMRVVPQAHPRRSGGTRWVARRARVCGTPWALVVAWYHARQRTLCRAHSDLLSLLQSQSLSLFALSTHKVREQR